MALNGGSLGVNIPVTTQDNGATTWQDRMTHGWETMKGMIGGVTDSLVAFATSQGELTTGYEAMLIHNKKTTTAMAANFGIVGQAATNFTQDAQNKAIALNVSIESAANALQQLKLAGKEYGDVGITTAEQLIKLQAVTGLNAQQLTSSLRTMSRTAGLGAESMRDIFNTALKAGSAMGNAGESVDALATVMGELKSKMSASGRGDHPEELKEVAKGYYNVAQAVFEYSGNAKEARDIAGSITDKLIAGQAHMRDAFAGTKTDIADLVQNLTISGVDIEKSFSMMQHGPQGFMAGLAKLVGESKEKGKSVDFVFSQLSSRLSQTFGPDQTAVMLKFFQNATPASLKAMQSMEATKDQVKGLTDAFRVGRTPAEQMALSIEQFYATVRSGTQDSERYVANAKEYLDFFAKAAKESEKAGGLSGEVLKTLVGMDKLGLKALLPDNLQAAAGFAGVVLDRVGPALDSLGKIGIKMENLFSPGGLLMTGASSFFAMFSFNLIKSAKEVKESHDVTRSAFHEAFTNTIQNFKDMAWRAAGFILKVWDEVKGPVKEMWNTLTDWVKDTVIPTMVHYGKVIGYGLASSIMSALDTIYSQVYDKAPAAMKLLMPSADTFAVIGSHIDQDATDEMAAWNISQNQKTKEAAASGKPSTIEEHLAAIRASIELQNFSMDVIAENSKKTAHATHRTAENTKDIGDGAKSDTPPSPYNPGSAMNAFALRR